MPIAYLSGGRLGDFLQQLSVVYEKYLQTKDKAILYLSEKGDIFHFGLEKVYQDLAPILAMQHYILSFQIHKGETYDVDLTSWRRLEGSYVDRMSHEYSITWGAHPWVHHIPTDEKWDRYVVVNTTEQRFPDNLDWGRLIDEHGKDNLLYVCFDKKQHEHFQHQTSIEIRCHELKSLHELFVILHSCKLFVGSLSAPLSVALSMHTPTLIGFVGSTTNHPDYNIFRDMKMHIRDDERRRAYLLTLDTASERAQHASQLLVDIGLDVVVILAVPHEDKVLSNKRSLRSIYEKIVRSDDPWSYVFEDDIDTLEPIQKSELLEYEKISQTFFYLGCCGPSHVELSGHDINGHPVYHVEGGSVRGHHAVAFSHQGAQDFLDIFDKNENQSVRYADVLLEGFAQITHPPIVRYDLESYTEGHRGLFFQDRERFPSIIG